MRVDVVTPDGLVHETGLADGEHTEVSGPGGGVLFRVVQIRKGHVRVEIAPGEQPRPKLTAVLGGTAA